jgi:hypothetical protein
VGEEERERDAGHSVSQKLNLKVQEELYMNGIVKRETSPSPPPQQPAGTLLSTATSVITQQTTNRPNGTRGPNHNHNNNNEPGIGIYLHEHEPIKKEVKDERMDDDSASARGTGSCADEFILPHSDSAPPAPHHPHDPYAAHIITDSLDDHSELIIIKPGPGFDFQIQTPLQYSTPTATAPAEGRNQHQHQHQQQYEIQSSPAVPVPVSIIVNNPNPAQPRKTFSCTLCSKVFKNGRIARAHQERVHDKLARYFCPTCRGAFSYR